MKTTRPRLKIVLRNVKAPGMLCRAKQKALFEIDSFTEKENSNETETLVTVANHEAKGL